jgi:hypothetical protein
MHMTACSRATTLAAPTEYDELHDILRGMMTEKCFRADAPKPLRIAARRLAAGRGAVGFGNGRAVRTYVESSVRRQQERLASACEDGMQLGECVNVLTRADLLGPCQMPEQLAAVAELEAMVGLAGVKKQVRSLLGMMAENLRREADEEPPLKISLNRLFLGCARPALRRPKHTCARHINTPRRDLFRADILPFITPK